MAYITVFGGSGFVGRYIVKRLAGRAHRIRVAVRDPERALSLKPMGDVGQIVPIQANLRHDASVRRAIAGADAVVNCVGILYESGAQRFAAVQAAGAGRIAVAAADAGIARMVQISAIGADAGSAAAYARSKAAGEAAVREALATATILRPSIVFGPEDDFFNRFASLARVLPALPLIGGGETRFQPVYVGDVAEAAVRALESDSYAGKTYELGGPQIFTFREVLEYILAETGRKRLLLPLPFAIAKIEAAILQLAPKPLLTMDQVEMLKADTVVADGAEGLEAFGIAPTPVQAIVPSYLARYRRGGRLTATPES